MNREHKYKDKDEYKDNDKDKYKDADKNTEEDRDKTRIVMMRQQCQIAGRGSCKEKGGLLD